MIGLSANLTQAVFVYLFFILVYLDIRELGKFFLWSSYHFLFKNVDVDGLDRNLCGHLLLEYCFAVLTKYNYVGDSL